MGLIIDDQCRHVGLNGQFLCFDCSLTSYLEEKVDMKIEMVLITLRSLKTIFPLTV